MYALVHINSTIIALVYYSDFRVCLLSLKISGWWYSRKNTVWVADSFASWLTISVRVSRSLVPYRNKCPWEKKKHTRTNSNKNHAIILKWNYFLALTTIHQIIYRSSYGKYSRRNAFKLNIHSKLSSPTWRDGIHIFIHAYIIYTSIILYSVFTFIYKNKVLPAYPTYTKYTSICLTCIRTSIYIFTYKRI